MSEDIIEVEENLKEILTKYKVCCEENDIDFENELNDILSILE